MKIIIVGGVAGGAGAAARLRRNEEHNEIVLMERGRFISFANCGLPYYIGNVITERSSLLLQDPEGFHKRFNVDVRIETEVLSVDTSIKKVTAKNKLTGEIYTETYDKLILSPGAKPLVPPIPGVQKNSVFTLRNMEDAFAIKDYIIEKNPQSAAVIGGGYIGLEMAENLKKTGLAVSVIEAMPHVIATLDMDMAAELQNHIRENGVQLFLNARATAINDAGVVLNDGNTIAADIVLLSVGVRPETEFLKDGKIALGARGEILVNSRMETNAQDVYALGDAISVTNIVSGGLQVIPLASPANKQARIVADVVSGKKAEYRGSQGTAIAKIFKKSVAVTGMSEAQLCEAKIPYKKAITYSLSNASYYPGSTPMTVKIMFAPDSGRLLGAQIIGGCGVDKRIDVLATSIRRELTVFDLQELELAYAPPFSSAKDPVNMAGYVGGNIVDGMCNPIYAEQLCRLTENMLLLDVRTPEEYASGTIGKAINCELDGLREKLDMLPKDKELIIFCRIGQRAHVAQCILKGNGYNTRNLIGGYLLYEQLVKNDSSFEI